MKHEISHMFKCSRLLNSDAPLCNSFRNEEKKQQNWNCCSKCHVFIRTDQLNELWLETTKPIKSLKQIMTLEQFHLLFSWLATWHTYWLVSAALGRSQFHVLFCSWICKTSSFLFVKQNGFVSQFNDKILGNISATHFFVGRAQTFYHFNCKIVNLERFITE